MSALISEKLFEEVLIKPALEGADTLLIVSGYASSAMVFHHLNKTSSNAFNVKLLVGMTPSHGLSETNHLGFRDIVENQSKGRLECSYLQTFPVHSKIYTWLKGGQPFRAFSGSANYSQNAFLKNYQREVCSEISPKSGKEYFESLIDSSIFCQNLEADFVLDKYKKSVPTDALFGSVSESPSEFNEESKVTISFINKSKIVSQRSGLNWGQRPELGREPNQAYIPVPMSIARGTFFPDPRLHFTVNTDDGKLLICSRGQQGGKAIQTPHNNSLFGEYFRSRLGLASGELVTRQHFQNYGRHTVDFYKVDEENYFMDFSV